MEAPKTNGSSVALAEANDSQQTTDQAIRPAEKRPLGDILADLRRPIPQRLLEIKTLQGNRITFIPWHRAQKILNHYTNGFCTYEVRDRTITDHRIMLTVRVTIHAQEGTFFQDGTGIEDLTVKGYGDEQSNAESMAFRRACARFGLGLDLYNG